MKDNIEDLKRETQHKIDLLSKNDNSSSWKKQKIKMLRWELVEINKYIEEVEDEGQ